MLSHGGIKTILGEMLFCLVRWRFGSEALCWMIVMAIEDLIRCKVQDNMFGKVLEGIKKESSGPFYWNLIIERSSLRAFYHYNHCGT